MQFRLGYGARRGAESRGKLLDRKPGKGRHDGPGDGQEERAGVARNHPKLEAVSAGELPIPCQDSESPLCRAETERGHARCYGNHNVKSNSCLTCVSAAYDLQAQTSDELGAFKCLPEAVGTAKIAGWLFLKTMSLGHVFLARVSQLQFGGRFLPCDVP